MLGSDRISTIEEPVVDILLDIREGVQSKRCALELNVEQLDGLIDTLENINKVMGTFDWTACHTLQSVDYRCSMASEL